MAGQTWAQHKVAIVGVGATQQGAHPGKTASQLGLEAIKQALDDAGIDKSAIDGMVTARQLDGSGIAPLEMSRLMGIEPKVTGYLDYGTAGFTTQYAAMLLATGVCETVLCVFGRNPPGVMHAYSGEGAYDRDVGLFNAAVASSFGWAQHMAMYGSSEETLGQVMVTARDYARLNPIAAWKDPLTLDDYLAQPYSIWPLRSYDIVKVTAGAVAIVMSRGDRVKDLAKPPVYLHAVGRQQTPIVSGDPEHFLCRGMRRCAAQLYDAAGMRPGDIDVLFASDASTVALPLTLENYGFCQDGESPEFIAKGGIGPGGAMPMNTNGGQLSEGYLVGWLHHVELVRQLRGECGERQVAGASVAQYCATGRLREDYLASIYTTGA